MARSQHQSIPPHECAEKLKALSDETRFLIISTLMDGPSTVKDMLRQIDIPQNLMSHHLRILRMNGIVHSKREGRGVIYSLADEVRTKGRQALNLGCCQLKF